MSLITENAEIKAIVRQMTGQQKVRVSRSSGWLFIKLFEPIPDALTAEIEQEMVECRYTGTYIGDFTPSIQPRLPCCHVSVESPT